MTDRTETTAQVRPGTAVSPSATPPVDSGAGARAFVPGTSQSRLEATGLRKSYGARMVVTDYFPNISIGDAPVRKQ